MIEGHIIFNAILYSIVIAYILYINFSAYYQTGTGFLRALVNLFQNWIFRTVYLLIVGFFALDLFPYGGFVLAILLTIAFLNTNMLVYKKDVEESLSMQEEPEKKKLPMDVPIVNQTQTASSTPTYPSPSSTGAQSNTSMNKPQIPTYPSPSSTGAQSNTYMNQPPPPANIQPQPPQQQYQPPQQQVVQQNPQQPMPMPSTPRQI
jgi:hypothetical protein